MSPEVFHAHFADLAQTTQGLKRVREMILDLAVQGRLLPQAADDEPASALLAHILSDIKEPANTSVRRLESLDGPFPIPSSWIWAKGSTAFTFITSGSRGWAQFYSDEGAIFLRIGNLDYGTTSLDLSSIQRVSPPADAEGSRTRVQAGDTLISITGDIGMIGLVPENLGEAYINQHIALARPSTHLHAPYIARALMAPSILGRLQQMQRGIKNSLGLNDIKEQLIPIPPLKEQKRIVAKVDQLMALCDELEARQTRKRDTGKKLTRSALEALTSAEGPEEFAEAWGQVGDNFEVLFDKPERVEELRKAVLELAIRGKLVSQSANDEPASTILDKIAIERAQTIRSGTNAKAKNPPKTDSTMPFAIPTGWEWVRWGILTLSSDSGWSPKCEGRPRERQEWGVLNPPYS